MIEVFQNRERPGALLPPFEVKVTGADGNVITSASITWEIWERAEERVVEVADDKELYKKGLILETFKNLFPELPELLAGRYPITIVMGTEDNGWKVEVTPKVKQ